MQDDFENQLESKYNDVEENDLEENNEINDHVPRYKPFKQTSLTREKDDERPIRRHNRAHPRYAKIYNAVLYPEDLIGQNRIQSMVNEEELPEERIINRSLYNLQELQDNIEVGHYDDNYFTRPLIGRLPRNVNEQINEELQERQCKCYLHTKSSYLDRLATAQTLARRRARISPSARERLKPLVQEYLFYNTPEPTCTANYRNIIDQFQEQGLKIGRSETSRRTRNTIPRNVNLHTCYRNYNFQDIPTNELYSLALSISQTRRGRGYFENLPNYTTNANRLERSRPILIEMLDNWQQGEYIR